MSGADLRQIRKDRRLTGRDAPRDFRVRVDERHCLRADDVGVSAVAETLSRDPVPELVGEAVLLPCDSAAIVAGSSDVDRRKPGGFAPFAGASLRLNPAEEGAAILRLPEVLIRERGARLERGEAAGIRAQAIVAVEEFEMRPVRVGGL